MSVPVISIPTGGLVQFGLQAVEGIYYQLTREELRQKAVKIGEILPENSPLTDAGTTARRNDFFTDGYIVKDGAESGCPASGNQLLDEKYFQVIQQEITDYFSKLEAIWIGDYYSCADRGLAKKIRAVHDSPSGNLLALELFTGYGKDELEFLNPDWEIYEATGLELDPAACGIVTTTAAVISFKHKVVLIAGAGYMQEVKESLQGC